MMKNIYILLTSFLFFSLNIVNAQQTIGGGGEGGGFVPFCAKNINPLTIVSSDCGVVGLKVTASSSCSFSGYIQPGNHRFFCNNGESNVINVTESGNYFAIGDDYSTILTTGYTNVVIQTEDDPIPSITTNFSQISCNSSPSGKVVIPNSLNNINYKIYVGSTLKTSSYGNGGNLTLNFSGTGTYKLVASKTPSLLCTPAPNFEKTLGDLISFQMPSLNIATSTICDGAVTSITGSNISKGGIYRLYKGTSLVKTITATSSNNISFGSYLTGDYKIILTTPCGNTYTTPIKSIKVFDQPIVSLNVSEVCNDIFEVNGSVIGNVKQNIKLYNDSDQFQTSFTLDNNGYFQAENLGGDLDANDSYYIEYELLSCSKKYKSEVFQASSDFISLPSISINNINSRYCLGNTLSLSVSKSGAGTISYYKWYYHNGSSFTLIPNESSSNLSYKINSTNINSIKVEGYIYNSNCSKYEKIESSTTLFIVDSPLQTPQSIDANLEQISCGNDGGRVTILNTESNLHYTVKAASGASLSKMGNGTTLNFDINGSGNISVEVYRKSSNSCANSPVKTFNIGQIIEYQSPIISMFPSSLCQGSSTSLTISNVINDRTYKVYKGSELLNTVVATSNDDIKIENLTTGTYKVAMETICGSDVISSSFTVSEKMSDISVGGNLIQKSSGYFVLHGSVLSLPGSSTSKSVDIYLKNANTDEVIHSFRSNADGSFNINNITNINTSDNYYLQYSTPECGLVRGPLITVEEYVMPVPSITLSTLETNYCLFGPGGTLTATVTGGDFDYFKWYYNNGIELVEIINEGNVLDFSINFSDIKSFVVEGYIYDSFNSTYRIVTKQSTDIIIDIPPSKPQSIEANVSQINCSSDEGLLTINNSDPNIHYTLITGQDRINLGFGNGNDLSYSFNEYGTVKVECYKLSNNICNNSEHNTFEIGEILEFKHPSIYSANRNSCLNNNNGSITATNLIIGQDYQLIRNNEVYDTVVDVSDVEYTFSRLPIGNYYVKLDKECDINYRSEHEIEIKPYTFNNLNLLFVENNCNTGAARIWGQLLRYPDLEMSRTITLLRKEDDKYIAQTSITINEDLSFEFKGVEKYGEYAVEFTSECGESSISNTVLVDSEPHYPTVSSSFDKTIYHLSDILVINLEIEEEYNAVHFEWSYREDGFLFKKETEIPQLEIPILSTSYTDIKCAITYDDHECVVKYDEVSINDDERNPIQIQYDNKLVRNPYYNPNIADAIYMNNTSETHDLYWQSDVRGFDDSNSAIEIPNPSPGLYGIRAKNKETGLWSENISWIIIEDEVNSNSTGFTQELDKENINYISTYVARKPGLNKEGVLSGNYQDDFGTLKSTNYFDHLGRPIQSVQEKGSTNGYDIVSPKNYDEFDRENRQYLSYVSNENNGELKESPLSELQTYYKSTVEVSKRSSYPFSEARFDGSPLNRVVKSSAEGDEWTGLLGQSKLEHSIKANTRLNTFDDQIKIVDGTAVSGLYEEGVLNISESSDEHGNFTVEVKDQYGQVILKRVQNGLDQNTGLVTYNDTYYTYDVYGNLELVIPPLAVEGIGESSTISNEIIENLCYQYQYDDQNRLIAKKLPGKGWEYMVYDHWDRLVLTQDANLAQEDKWIFTKYDAFNRPVISGIKVFTEQEINDLKVDLADAESYTNRFESRGGILEDYTNVSLPSIAADDILSVTYYNDYDWLDGTMGFVEYDDKFDEDLEYGIEKPSALPSIKGQITGSKVRVLGTNQFLTTVTYYDHKYRVTQTQTESIEDIDIVTNQYNFSGEVVKTYLDHSTTTEHIYVANENTYDHVGRLLETTNTTERENLSGENTVVSDTTRFEYNELGELVKKTAGTKEQPLLHNYSYNIRGWSMGVNADAQNLTKSQPFIQNLYYTEDKLEALNVDAQFNGNIAKQSWQSFNDPTNYRSYEYSYDMLNRLKKADYNSNNSTEDYDVTGNDIDGGIEYDANGNILSLFRQGFRKEQETPGYGQIDQLTYSYLPNSNQLLDVADASDYKPADFKKDNSFFDAGTGQAFSYDVNGNLEKDENKGITSIEYNHLNLPTLITFDNGNSVEYLYDAAGIKLQKTANIKGEDEVFKTTVTKYIGSFVYEDKGDGDKLQFLHTAEGRILTADAGVKTRFASESLIQEYHYKDHLGNLRASVRLDEVIEEDFEDTESQFNLTEEDIVAAVGGRQGKVHIVEGASVGASITIPVEAGEKIYIGAYGYYIEDDDQTATQSQMSDMNSGSTTQIDGEGTSTNGDGTQMSLPLMTFSSGDDPTPTAFFRVKFVDSEEEDIKKEITVANQWQLIEHNLVVPEGVEYIEISFENETPDVNVYFDDVTITFDNYIVQENHYYPFGMNMAGIEKKGTPDHKFQYNGKEKQEEIGFYDYGARMLDVKTGRWFAVDPLAEKMTRHSVYNYAFDNPIRFIDSDGRKPDDFIYIDYKTKNVTIVKDSGLDRIYWIKDGKQVPVGSAYNESWGSYVDNVKPSKTSEIYYEEPYTFTGNYTGTIDVFNAEGFISAGNDREIITDIIVDEYRNVFTPNAIDGGLATPVIMEGYSTGDVLAFTGKDKWDSKRFFTASEGVNLGEGSIFGLAPFGNIYTYTGDAKDFSLENNYGGGSYSYTFPFPIPWIRASLILTLPLNDDKYNTYGIGLTPGYNLGVQKNTTKVFEGYNDLIKNEK